MSVHGPAGVHWSDHCRQKASALCRARSASTGRGGGSWDGPYVNTKGIVSPALISNSPMLLRSSPRSGTGVRSTTRSGPAIAEMPPSGSCSTQGTIEP